MSNKTSKGFLLTIAALTLFNLIVGLVVLSLGSRELTGDQVQYNQLAVNLVEQGTFSLQTDAPYQPTVYRTPGYPVFLATLYKISSNSVLFVQIVQYFLVGIIAWLVFALAKEFTDEKHAKITAILFLTYLPFLFLASMIVTEVISTLLCISIILILKKYRWMNNNKIIWDIVLGLILGCLAIIRPSTALLVFPIVAILWGLKWRGKIQLSATKVFVKSAILGLGILVVFTPWIIRNYIITNKFIPMTVMTSSETLFYSLWQYEGIITYAFSQQEWQTVYFPDLFRRYREVDEQMNKGEIPANLANLPPTIQKEFLLEQNFKQSINEELRKIKVSTILKSSPKRFAYLWGTADYAPLDIYNGFLHRLGQLQYLILFGLIILGIFLGYRQLSDQWMLWLLPFYLTAIHFIFLVEGRYTLPARPLLLIYCSIAIVWLWNRFVKKGESIS
ncbi:MAG: ArnT family glycosyltransferase [Pyrinomonadaceae bacterium]